MFFKNDTSNTSHGLLKAFENAQNFEKHPPNVEKAFSKLFGHLEVGSKF